MSLWCCTVTADPRVQPAEVCEMQPTLGTSISSIAFYIFLMLSCKMTWMRCLSISHVFSISSVACFTCCAVWDPWNYCAYRHIVTRKRKKYNIMPRLKGTPVIQNSRWRRKPWTSTTEMSWLSRVIHLFTLCNIFGHVAVSRMFLCPFESTHECLLLWCLCLYCLSELVVFVE